MEDGVIRKSLESIWKLSIWQLLTGVMQLWNWASTIKMFDGLGLKRGTYGHDDSYRLDERASTASSG